MTASDSALQKHLSQLSSKIDPPGQPPSFSSGFSPALKNLPLTKNTNKSQIANPDLHLNVLQTWPHYNYYYYYSLSEGMV